MTVVCVDGGSPIFLSGLLSPVHSSPVFASPPGTPLCGEQLIRILLFDLSAMQPTSGSRCLHSACCSRPGDTSVAIASAACFVAAAIAVKVFTDVLWPYRWFTAALPCVLVGSLSLIVLAAECVCPSRFGRETRPELLRAVRAYVCPALLTGMLDAATVILALTSMASLPAQFVLIALAAPDAARALGSLATARAVASREGRHLTGALLAAHATGPLSL